jgi:signal transduction histidine kinase
MRKRLHKLIIKLRKYIPLSRDLRNEFKRIILTLQITFIGIIACILFSIIDSLHQHYYSVLQNMSAIAIFVFAIYLITKGKFKEGKLLIVLYSCLTLLVNASRDGRYAGNEFLWFPILGGIFLFFSAKEKMYIFISLVFALICITLLEYTDYAYMLYKDSIVGVNYLNYILSFSTSAAMVSLFMYYLRNVNTDSEKKLERLNHTLVHRNENLRKINNELDSFVYKASHDMRAPLTSLLGLIEVSKKETDLVLIKEFSMLQEKSIKKLDSYIVDILNISRNARMDIEMKEIDFKEIIESVFLQFSYLDNCSSIKKNVKINQIEKFNGDKTRINIIFSNLISNSIRYMDTTKAEPVIDISITTTGKMAEIIIVDNGMGIPQTHLNKVFNMFYRATDNNSGSGLGLYIVKETLLKLRGSIHINSEYRKYTSISIQIPNNLSE